MGNGSGVSRGDRNRNARTVAIPLAWPTALSRTSLNAHWLSDVVGGVALGTGYALAARLIDYLAVQLRRRVAPATA